MSRQAQITPASSRISQPQRRKRGAFDSAVFRQNGAHM
ncbi:hypothetical protein SLEP1_g26851 [Rubroshorea leprosula]|uniref:Uncharacterized protein n=1 Tax=Rubroshorea leprosula TaxID=152421 RepID=A0AAV5JXQ6_9ROSI|nr:hypothetical protein SLEP1_g26851 [Rubroshorea leprosula]